MMLLNTNTITWRTPKHPGLSSAAKDLRIKVKEKHHGILDIQEEAWEAAQVW